MRLRTLTACAGALTLSLVTGCAQGDGTGASSNTVTYWLWDANQLPAYRACAEGFEKENPGLKVKISQLGWSDYWTKLTAGFIAGTQPDVFTDHIQNFGQFADLEVLEPLDDLGIEDSAYQPGLAANWIGQDGRRYGAPKDWDTVALFYNKKLAKDAGLTADELNEVREHPWLGERIVAPLECMNGLGRQVIACHHERWDGSGYPRGLRGLEIPLAARIFAVVDAFDAMTNPQPYREPLPVEYALAEIEDKAGTHFDPAVVYEFLALPAEGSSENEV